MKNKYITIIAALTMTISSLVAQNLERAKLYNEHGLNTEAKSECILIVTGNNPDNEKSAAYYLLGLIAFNENRIANALETWTKLTLKFPQSQESKEVTERIKDLAQIVGETKIENLNNAVAQSYLSHGEFWSSEKSEAFIMDCSWIPKVEAAIKWYDKMITEYPKTVAAKVGYEQKMKTIIGWSGSDRYADSQGIVGNPKKYIPLLIETFSEYETSFPESGNLQAFRYQIAQAYWKKKDWANTRLWLNKIISNSDGGDSFYSDLAQRRLQKVEY